MSEKNPYSNMTDNTVDEFHLPTSTVSQDLRRSSIAYSDAKTIIKTTISTGNL